MFTNDRSEVPDLFGGAGWQTSGWPPVEVVERRGFVSFVFSRLPQDVYTWESERKTVFSVIHEASKEVILQNRQGDCVQTTPVLLMLVGTVSCNNAFRHTNWNALCVEINLVNISLCQHSYNDFEKGYP